MSETEFKCGEYAQSGQWTLEQPLIVEPWQVKHRGKWTLCPHAVKTDDGGFTVPRVAVVDVDNGYSEVILC